MNPTKSCPACFEQIDARALRCPNCAQRQSDAPPLHRDVPGRLVGGVCAALALHFNWDVTVMRLVVVASLVSSAGVGVWLYALGWLMTPFEQGGKSPALRFVDWVGHLFATPAAEKRPGE
jgi:phage shock protein PspC (stress-responsive transcriptional regulator)